MTANGQSLSASLPEIMPASPELANTVSSLMQGVRDDYIRQAKQIESQETLIEDLRTKVRELEELSERRLARITQLETNFRSLQMILNESLETRAE